MLKLVVASLLLFSHTAMASQSREFFSVKRADQSTGVEFSIGWTFGTHKGHANTVSGLAVLNANDQLQSARFVVPIAGMTTGNKTRDCHMIEALGIDYSQSIFPKEHVCNKRNELPTNGPNAPRFNAIVFEFAGFNRGPVTPIAPDVWQDVHLSGNIKIHNVIKNIPNIPAKVITTTQNGKSTLRIVTSLELMLPDFGVIVKKMGPIGVKKSVKVDLDMLMAER